MAMNKLVPFFIMIILFVSGCCVTEERSPIEGAWKWVYADYSMDNQANPVQEEGDIIKFWTGGHFSFIGQLKSGSTIEDRYGWGTYELNGDRYIENITFHYEDAYMGESVRMIMNIRNDTLIQQWPVDENWMLPEIFNTEKYVRRENSR